MALNSKIMECFKVLQYLCSCLYGNGIPQVVVVLSVGKGGNIFVAMNKTFNVSSVSVKVKMKFVGRVVVPNWSMQGAGEE